MLTDQQAHDLLHLAADTVEVGNAPIPVPTSRRVWPLVAAAASVVLVVGGAAVVAGSGDQKPNPAPAPNSSDDGQFRLGTDQVPSVFGYTAEDAVAMLETQGLKASIAPIPINACGETPGRAISVDPPAGTVVKPGDPVVVRSPGPVDGVPSSGFCTLETYRRDDAWALIDYAHGRRDKPTTAPGVDLGPLVERLRNWSAEVGRYEQGRAGQNQLRWPTPRLTTTPASQFSCVEMSDQMDYADLLALTVEIDTGPTDGVGARLQCQTVLVAYSADGTIINVAVPDSIEPEDPLVPADVVGNTVAFATDRLEAQGLKVEPIGRADCQPIGIITAQQPYPLQDVPAGTTIVLAYTDETGPCIKDSLEIETPARAAVESFIEFARGGELPPVADSIDVYAGNVLRTQLSAEDAADRGSWRTECPAIRDSLCLASVIERVQSDKPSITQPFLRDNGPCHFVEGTLPDELTSPDALSRSASFGGGEPRTCADNWEAQLWLDEDGRIYAVNLILGNPLADD